MGNKCIKLSKDELKKNPTRKVKLEFSEADLDKKNWEKKTGIFADWEFNQESDEESDEESNEKEIDIEDEGVFYNADLRLKFGDFVNDDPPEIQFDMTYFLKGNESRWEKIVELADPDNIEACGERVKDKDGKYKEWVK